MKYMGSKNRYAKEIISIITKGRECSNFYVEPFCGGCNVIDKIPGYRLASDINPYLIALLQALKDGWVPPIFVSEEFYREVKQNKDCFPPHLVGYVGFCISYAGRFFGGYSRDSQGKRDYSKEAYNNVIKQAPLLKPIIFKCCDYRDCPIPSSSFIYCDPPYPSTKKYAFQGKDFDYQIFWDWCRYQSRFHKIFISSYEAPPDFTCIWQKQVNSSLTKDTGSKTATEKLFTKTDSA